MRVIITSSIRNASVALFLGGASVSCSISEARLDGIACDLAFLEIQRATRDGTVVTPGLIASEALHVGLGRLLWEGIDGRSAEIPPKALLESFSKRQKVSVFQRCPDLPKELRKAGIPLGMKATQQALKPPEDDPSRRGVFSISFPAISEEGSEALILESSYLGSEASGGQIFYLRKSSEGWRRIAAARVSIS